MTRRFARRRLAALAVLAVMSGAMAAAVIGLPGRDGSGRRSRRLPEPLQGDRGWN